MLKSIQIKNFKTFQDTCDLDIKPITILVGPNSSGKSSILKALLMLRQTIDSTDMENPLVTNGSWVSIGAYPEFIYNGESDRDLQIRLVLDCPLFGNSTKRVPLLIQSVFTYVKSRTRIRLKHGHYAFLNTIIDLDLKSKSSKYYEAIIDRKDDKGKSKQASYKSVLPLKFYSLKISDRSRTLPNYFTDVYFISSHVESFFKNVFYIGPLRDYPKRIYLTSGDAPQDVGQRGERAVDALWFSHLSEKKKVENIENITRKWFKQFGFSSDIKLNRLSKEGINYEFLVTDEKTGFYTNIADVGFGVSQTLPIVIESFYAPEDSLILIEQPEIHLHPKAQATLGDLFIEAISKRDRQFIIETHSEHLIARIRRRIAENPELSKDDIAIYYFHKTTEGTKIEKVTLNEYGQLEDFPEGFFDESYYEAFNHMKVISEKRKQ